MTGPSYDDLLRAALREDLGTAGDITTLATIPASAIGTAIAVAREPGIVSGIEPFVRTFAMLDPNIQAERRVRDGDRVERGTAIVTLHGPLRPILSAERTALNLFCRLSGIATATRRFVDLIAGTHAQILDTRKTTPGLRALEKQAVLDGGGRNHRFGLYDAILVKDNHVAVAGGVGAAVRAARKAAGHHVEIEVEVDSLGQLDEALEAGADSILLDNFSVDDVQTAVERVAGRVPLEVSGGIDEHNVRAIALAGVDRISIGALTHSVKALDVGLDVNSSAVDAGPRSRRRAP